MSMYPDDNITQQKTVERTGRKTSGSNVTYWLDSTEPFATKKLTRDLSTDVVVIGGGISGVSVAYNLCMSGRKVILLEDGNIGSGETGRTSAHLVSALDDRYYDLEKTFGEEDTKLIAESHARAIDFTEANALRERIDCDFKRVPGYLFLHPNDRSNALKQELQAARKAGLLVEELHEIPGMKEKGHCLRFDNQAQFHPLKYIKGLCEAIESLGGEIYTDTHVTEVTSEGVSTAEGYYVSARYIVVASNSPVNSKYLLPLRQYAYRSYVIGMLIKKNTVPDALWWDTGDPDANSDFQPYHYVRKQEYDEQYDLLICGGEDHPTGLAEINDEGPEQARYERLEHWARKRFPVENTIYHWSGQIMEPMDAIGYIGKSPMDEDNIYIITGDSGNGLTNAGVAAILIPALIDGQNHPWEKLYSPARFKLSSGKTFVKEMIGGTIDYLKTKPKKKEREDLIELPSGEGMIIDMDGEKFAVYRDPQNKLHCVEAECTHLKCIIKWNTDEKTWDCPCHGSRFTYEGKVINGPANSNLSYRVLKNETELWRDTLTRNRKQKQNRENGLQEE